MPAHILTAPIPPYQNVPIEPQFYAPSRFIISAIALGKTTTVTATTTMNYVIGQLVRLIIPRSFGTRQLNEQQGYVISLPTTNSVEINIDSSKYDPFTTSSATTKPQILAIGDVNMGYIDTNGRDATVPIIPGSFINISPL